jgi:hypothetical protein
LVSGILFLSFIAIAQEKEEEEEKEKMPFKQTLFTGGSISLAFYNSTFLIGANPVFGSSLTKWLDAGIVVNYSYTSQRHVQQPYDRLRQTVYGGGAFVKLYPVRFLFAQAQVEKNWIHQKYIPSVSGITIKDKMQATSYLIGGGYTTGRNGRGGEPFYYLAVLFDISGNIFSPYTEGDGSAIPIIRAGLQIPLFQNSGEADESPKKGF